MRISVVSLLMILTTVFLSACAKDDMAALDDRSQNFYGKNGVITAANYAALAPASQMSAPVMPITSANLATPPHSLAASASASPHIIPKFTTQNVRAASQMPAVITSANGWQWPVEGKVAERFGKQGAGIANEGITIAAAQGTPIHAASAGEVAYVGTDVRDYGNIVILRHAGGEMTSYAHAADITVRKGQQVGAGGIIGHVGTSGGVKTPQLHFAMRSGERAVDPLSKLPSQLASQ